MNRDRRIVWLLTIGAIAIASAFGIKAAMQAVARRYVIAALDTIQKNSVRRHDVNWDSLRAQALGKARDAVTRSQTYDGIRFVLESLGDRHSGFVDPDTMSRLTQVTAAASLPAEGRILAQGIGYVTLRQFASPDQIVIDNYATELQRIIKDVDLQQPCGWIADLRENGGGNMWPMLAGLGPILGEGKLGAFVDPDGASTDWSYRDGRALEGNEPRARVTEATYHLNAVAPPVAVLTSATTASSAEAVAIALRGRPNTRSFGQRTRGLTTSNNQFVLSDGAMINLSVSTFADREGHRYPDGIAPDESVVNVERGSIPTAARDWLLNQPACRTSSRSG